MTFNTKWSLLMKKVQAGHKEAYLELLDQIGPLIFRYISRRCNDQYFAEEVYQESLLNLHKARHTYDCQYPFEPWLYAITKNTLFKFLKKQTLQRQSDILDEEVSYSSTNHFNKTNQSSSFDDQLDLESMLDTLPNDQKESIKLVKLEGLKMKEAANKLGISVSAMKVRVHRAIHQLRKKFRG